MTQVLVPKRVKITDLFWELQVPTANMRAKVTLMWRVNISLECYINANTVINDMRTDKMAWFWLQFLIQKPNRLHISELINFVLN